MRHKLIRHTPLLSLVGMVNLILPLRVILYDMSVPRLTYCMVVSFYHKIDGLMMGAICVLINVAVFRNSYDTKFDLKRV